MDNPGLTQKDGIDGRRSRPDPMAASIKRSASSARGAGRSCSRSPASWALMIFFSFASPSFMQTDNIVGILQATAVNGVLAIACTFVIITGGIDLSVGTLMTFCAVMAGVFLTYWGLPFRAGIVAAIFFGALSGFVSGALIAKLKIPPFIATLGMMLVLKGLSLVISGDQADLFQRHAAVSDASRRIRCIGYLLPNLPIPNAVLILFVVAIVSPPDPQPARCSAATPSRSAATRRRCGSPA